MRKSILLLLLIGLLAFSCGLNNTMYNARKYFEAARERPLNANGHPNPQAIQEYTKAIKKCGIILSREKTGRNTDDALFLMAKALYYKGNSAFQAKDQFEALINGFPESPFYSEAHIYLARVLREINRKEEAETLLETFVNDPEHEDWHPEALLTLTEFEIEDLDYNRAQYWLEKIITQYPKSDEYREAFFLFGKNYFIQEDYAASLREFQRISTARRIPQSLKLEARYYIALNQFLLGETDESWKTIIKLIRDENRPEELSQTKVIKGRLHFARGEDEDGIAELEGVTQAYPRTESSSQAQYYLAEHYFHQAKDLDKALAAYNKAKSEFSQSELAETAQQKAAAINQLKQGSTLDQEANLQQFVDHHIAAAENYYSQFALRDSAIVMYQRLIDSKDSLSVLKDSLNALARDKQALIDSLTAQLELLPEPVSEDSLEITDSLAAMDEIVPQDSLAMADSLKTIPGQEMQEQAPADSQKVVAEDEPTAETDDAANAGAADEIGSGAVIPEADSLNMTELEEVSDSTSLPDSLGGSPEDMNEPEIPDSSAVAEEGEDTKPPPDPAEQRRILEQRLTAAQTELSALESRLASLDGIFQSYEQEYIPLALFSQANIYNRSGADSTLIEAIHTRMEKEYPGNKYTNALEAMLTDAPIRLVDPIEEAQELRLDNALDLAETQPDSMLVILNELTESEYTPIKVRANFRLGWYYTFEEPDTTLARPHLEEVLNLEQQGDYAQMTTRFFDGSKFNLNPFDELAASIAEADSLKMLREMEAQADSLDKIEDIVAEDDSLDLAADSTAVADSLAKPEEPEEKTEGEEENGIQTGEDGERETTETPDRKEDPPEDTLPDEPLPDDGNPDSQVRPPDEPSG